MDIITSIMPHNYHIFLILSLSCFCLSLTLTYFIIKKLSIIDKPNERSSHQIPTPRSGGIAIFFSFVAIIAFILLLLSYGIQLPLKETSHFLDYISNYSLISLFVVIASIFTVGLMDDLVTLGFKSKLIVQILACVLLIYQGYSFSILYLPYSNSIELGFLGYMLTVLWFVGFINGFNFIDGLDGLASGTAFIGCFTLSLIFYRFDLIFLFYLFIFLSIAIFGFLIFNFPPAKIFLGDCGSQFIGVMIVLSSLLAIHRSQDPTFFWVPILIFFHFIWDVIYTLFYRLRKKENITQAHRSHLYQRLNQSGFSHCKVSFISYAKTCFYSYLAYLFITNESLIQIIVLATAFSVETLYTIWVTKKYNKAL